MAQMSMNFEFIFSDDINARRKARQHVVKEHHPQRRVRDAVFWKSSEDVASAESAVQVDSRGSSQVSANVVLGQEEAAPDESQRARGRSTSRSAPRPKRRGRDIHSRSSERASRDLVAVLKATTDFRPHSMLRQDHRDPFDSHPVAIPWQERCLVYHCQYVQYELSCLSSDSGVAL
jgi:hypothetical protein